MRSLNSRAFLASLALGMLAACGGTSAQDQVVVAEEQVAKPKLGLFTTLPIYWGEGGDIASILDGESKPDWVRTELETKFEIIPLDTLEAEALEGLDRVLLAQPRPLAPSENVAFDSFIASGNHALIIADPMLTRHSEYAIGDRRRPQEVVLLSPILQRFGAELVFDESQDEGERIVTSGGFDFPVNMAGQFRAIDTDAKSACLIEDATGLLARCNRGAGFAYLYADAAILDWEGDEPVPQARKDALWGILMPLETKGGAEVQP